MTPEEHRAAAEKILAERAQFSHMPTLAEQHLTAAVAHAILAVAGQTPTKDTARRQQTS
ncbi:hypothetical protein [Mycobacterium sp. OTB74]|jgi:hypothetical protein|uniref:hypothetical protein n=1 Tax=Mycobacterium sp. OTB74 TaxID=1853452 RepID=UPI00247421AB|nr:hypothetical protein [Mycobacterium sp. OTB74]MDH6247248.1 hypothetical protein [Mycobacterium sp. OTB74]